MGYSRGEFERTLDRLNPGDSLMISNWFNVYLTDITVKGRANTYPYVVDGERLEDHAKVREIYIADMRALASQLQQKGINLILVVDPPVLRREPVACEASQATGSRRSTGGSTTKIKLMPFCCSWLANARMSAM